MYVALEDDELGNDDISSSNTVQRGGSSASSASSLVPLVPADPAGKQRGLVILDFVRSISAVRSVPLFLFSLCIFVLLFLVNGLQVSCRGLREVDPAALPADPCLAEPARFAAQSHYNDVSGWEYWHATLLHVSFFPLFAANSRFNSPLLAVLCFVPPMAAQAYMIFYQQTDLAWCTLDRLGQKTRQCFDPQRQLLPPLQPPIVIDPVCEHWAQSACEANTADQFQYTALIQLSTIVALVVLLGLTAWGLVIAASELYSRYTGRPFTSPLLNYRTERQGPACIAVHRWLDTMYEKRFSSEAEKVENSQLDRSSPLYVLPFHLSLRIYFALSVSFVVLTAATVYVLLLLASQQLSVAAATQSITVSMVVAVLVAYCYSLLYMLVHVGAMRASIKRLLFRLHTAVEHNTLDETLHQLRLRWFSMPFYAGSLLGSLLWTFVLTTSFLFAFLFVLSSAELRSLIAPYVGRAILALLPSLLLLCMYRCCGSLFAFHRCATNPALPLVVQPSHPLCYLCWDCFGLFVGGWGSWVFIAQRLLLAIPIAVSRIDIPTSSFDWVAQQFSSVSVCEAYRIFALQKEWDSSSRADSANMLRGDGQPLVV